jgi:hypothetical protein
MEAMRHHPAWPVISAGNRWHLSVFTDRSLPVLVSVFFTPAVPATQFCAVFREGDIF